MDVSFTAMHEKYIYIYIFIYICIQPCGGFWKWCCAKPILEQIITIKF